MNELVHSGARAVGAARKAPAREPTRTNDPERTKANILEVASVEFGEKGLAGARIDEIAALTKTSKRMIYYYFSSKEGLYLAVLEEAYKRVRDIESELHLQDLEPEQALRRLVAFTFDHHLHHENYIRLVMNENIARGQYLAQSQRIQELNMPGSCRHPRFDLGAELLQRVQPAHLRPDLQARHEVERVHHAPSRQRGRDDRALHEEMIRVGRGASTAVAPAF
jgi:AcrR family transcriptional regulator